MKEAFITELAESDLAKIWAYIAQHDLVAAERFSDTLRGHCLRLAQAPERGRPREHFAPGLRSYRVKNYFIYYFVTDAGIEIARVLHSARDLPRIF